jgi:predicted SnoaL-like aldol condensation-catalyzing enzyme
VLTTLDTAFPVQINYQDILFSVYQSLVQGRGKIRGPFFCKLNCAPDTEFLKAFGIKPLIKLFSAINKALPPYELNIENMVVKGQKVMVKYHLQGVLQSSLLGVGHTGETVRVTILDVFRFDQDRVAEYWNVDHKIEPVKM